MKIVYIISNTKLKQFPSGEKGRFSTQALCLSTS